jgi:hypothetical protein
MTARWATSWVLSAVGRPVPTSRNWRMPWAVASWCTASMRNSRAARAISGIDGIAWMSGKVARASFAVSL